MQERYAALSQAILAGASTQLRNAATTAGNLLQRTRCVYFRNTATPCNKREPGSGCPAITGANRMMAILGTSEACIASNPSDMAVAMLAYDATVHVQGVSGTRSVALKDFFLLPQDRPDRENVLEAGDLITHVTLPPPPAGERSVYLKLRDRVSYEFALVSAAVAAVVANGKITQVRFALGGVGTRPWRVPEAEHALIGQEATEAELPSRRRTRARGRQAAEPERVQGRAREALHRRNTQARDALNGWRHIMTELQQPADDRYRQGTAPHRRTAQGDGDGAVHLRP